VRSKQAKKNGACHICGRFGHWKKDCSQKKIAEEYKRPEEETRPSLAFEAIHSDLIQNPSDSTDPVSAVSMQLRSGTVMHNVVDESCSNSQKIISMIR
jgi:hypothetical protein